MVTGRSRYKSAKKGREFKLEINLKKLFVLGLVACVLGYIVYAYIGFRNIKSENPLKSGNANLYLLSRYPRSFKKTLIVFEDEYNGEQRVNKVYLYAENKEKEESILVYVPNWVLFRGLESDFGNAVAVSGFRYAGDFKQPGKGIEYAVWQLEELLGMNVDEYIWFDSQSSSLLQENLDEMSSETIYSQYYQNGGQISDDVFFLNGFISRLSWFNLLFSASKFKDSNAVIYSSLGSLPNIVVELKNINTSIFAIRPFVIDFSNPQYLDQEQTDGVGGISNYVKTSEFDSVWRSNTTLMVDKSLEKERVRVEVYNASGISGKASDFARKVANSGCDVVRFETAPEEQSETTIYIPKKELFPESFKVISELIPGQFKEVVGRPEFMTTGDIVIILGQDLSGMYSF